MRYLPLEKAARLEIQTQAIQRKVNEGYTLEEYKGYKILHKADVRNTFLLMAFRPAAGQPYLFERRGSAERLAEGIKDIKGTADWKDQRKQERKTRPHNATKQSMIDALSAAGYNQRQVSVSENSAYYLTVRDAAVDLDVVEKIGKAHEHIHYDEMTHEILSGGNTFVFIGVTDEVKAIWAAKYLPAVQAAFKELEQFKAEGKLQNGAPIDEKANLYWDSNGFHLKVSNDHNWLPMNYSENGLQSIAVDLYQLRKESPAPEPVVEAKQVPLEVVAGQIQIVDYSERAFAVIGDTKPIKEKLSDLGGKFNARLTCGPGWIFSKRRLASVTEALTPKAKEVKPLTA